MKYLLGIDLGTSSIKAVLVDGGGSLLAIGQQQYTIYIPRPGWAEQDPDVWWTAAQKAVKQVLAKSKISAGDIAAVGFSGQMHGLVPLDSGNRSVRNAIIWCDHRSERQAADIENRIGRRTLSDLVHTPVVPGFFISSLLWMKENEPELYKKTVKVILPKDYIRYCFTGGIATDITDASGTACFDTGRGSWAWDMIDALGVPRDIFPAVYNPADYAGTVCRAAAAAMGLCSGTPVVYGGADQVMQAVGNGILNEGTASVTIGTGGQILMPLNSPCNDPSLRSHCFSFIDNTWYYLGATLSAGLSLKWFKSVLDTQQTYAGFDKAVAEIPAGSGGILFLPYLSGERSPCMDPEAKGMFFGLMLNHNRYHMIRAVMEGVVFSLRDCLEVMTEDMGRKCDTIVASGGGSQSPVWLQMQADILGRNIYVSETKEQAGAGAAITAGVGCGMYSGYADAVAKAVRWQSVPVTPDGDCGKVYEKYYGIYRQLYEHNKDLMHLC
jgi:xylulokinase